MANHVSPHDWMIPEWHADCAYLRDELSDLKALSLEVLAALPRTQVVLEAPEPGLIYVSLTLSTGTIVELYSVPSHEHTSQRQFGIFVDPGTNSESEQYCETVESARDFLIALSR